MIRVRIADETGETPMIAGEVDGRRSHRRLRAWRAFTRGGKDANVPGWISRPGARQWRQFSVSQIGLRGVLTYGGPDIAGRGEPGRVGGHPSRG
jgi:hypothetical protein